MTLAYQSEGEFRSLNIGLKGEKQVQCWACHLSAMIVLSKILGCRSAGSRGSDAAGQPHPSPLGLSESTNVGISSERLVSVLFELMEQDSIQQQQWADCFLFVERLESNTPPGGRIRSSAEHRRLVQSLCRIAMRWNLDDARTHLKSMLKCLHALEASSVELTLHLLNLLASIWRQGVLSPRTHCTSIQYFGQFHARIADVGGLVANAEDFSLMCDGLQLFLPSRQPPDLLPEIPTNLVVAVCTALTAAHQRWSVPTILPKVHIQIQIEELRTSDAPEVRKAADECLRSMARSDRSSHRGAVASFGGRKIPSSLDATDSHSPAEFREALRAREAGQKHGLYERPKIRLHRTAAIRDIGIDEGMPCADTNKGAQAFRGDHHTQGRERQGIYRVQGAKDLPQVRPPAMGCPAQCSDDRNSLYSDNPSTCTSGAPRSTSACSIGAGHPVVSGTEQVGQGKGHHRTRIRKVRAVASRALRDVEEQLSRVNYSKGCNDATCARKVSPKVPRCEGKENDMSPASPQPTRAGQKKEHCTNKEQNFRLPPQNSYVEFQGALAFCAAAALLLGRRQQV